MAASTSASVISGDTLESLTTKLAPQIPLHLVESSQPASQWPWDPYIKEIPPSCVKGNSHPVIRYGLHGMAETMGILMDMSGSVPFLYSLPEASLRFTWEGIHWVDE